jgi:hypothetical protein
VDAVEAVLGAMSGFDVAEARVQREVRRHLRVRIEADAVQTRLTRGRLAEGGEGLPDAAALRLRVDGDGVEEHRAVCRAEDDEAVDPARRLDGHMRLSRRDGCRVVAGHGRGRAADGGDAGREGRMSAGADRGCVGRGGRADRRGCWPDAGYFLSSGPKRSW